MPTNVPTLHIPLPKPIREKLKAAAKRDRRTMASWVLVLIEAALAKPAK